MPDEPLRPDVLVLAAGGTVGEAWMTGVLAGLEDGAGIDFREVEAVVGTSAGSIVGAGLVSGRSPRRPPGAADDPGGGGTMAAESPPRGPGARLAGAMVAAAGALAAPLAAPSLALGAPVGAAVRAVGLAAVPAGRRSLDGMRAWIERSGARFDGRLRVVAVERASGRRVVFGAPGAPPAGVGEAVAASCAVPGVFTPVTIGGRVYVDGGAWSLTNLDAAPAGRGTDVLCLSVTARARALLASPIGPFMAAARAAQALETLALRRRGASVRLIGPDAESADALGPNVLDPRRADGALAAGYRQGRALAR